MKILLVKDANDRLEADAESSSFELLFMFVWNSKCSSEIPLLSFFNFRFFEVVDLFWREKFSTGVISLEWRWRWRFGLPKFLFFRVEQVQPQFFLLLFAFILKYDFAWSSISNNLHCPLDTGNMGLSKAARSFKSLALEFLVVLWCRWRGQLSLYWWWWWWRWWWWWHLCPLCFAYLSFSIWLLTLFLKAAYFLLIKSRPRCFFSSFTSYLLTYSCK